MADKFRVTFPIPVTMARGEQPTADKLNSISTQAKNGLALTERALGDLWTQSGDPVMGGEPLQISNLARNLGQQLYANAVFQKPDLGPSDFIRVNQSVITQRGQTEIHLDFKPEVGASTVLDTEMIAASYGLVANRESVTDASSYFADQDSGIIYLGYQFPRDDSPVKNEIEYDVIAANWPTDGSSESSYNVIPHPEMEDGWRGLKFVKRDDNKYLVYLPPRRPLKFNASAIGKIPREAENSVLPAATPVHRYWYVNIANWTNPVDITADADALAVAVSRRYRHKLPALIYDLVTTGSLGDTIPSGTIHLWDNTQNTILEGITFRVPEADIAYTGGLRPGWVIQIESPILDNLLEVGGFNSDILTDDPPDYKQRFSLISSGEGSAEKGFAIANAIISEINGLGVKPRLQHSHLLATNPVARSGSDTYTATPASYRDGDDHSYLLSREGSTAVTTTQRDRYNNAILGDLLIASIGGSTRQNITTDSQAVAFGDVTTGPRLRYDFVTNSNGVTDSTGTVVVGSNVLALDNFPLLLSKRTLLFASEASNIDGITYDDTTNIFRFFGDDFVNSSSVTMGSLQVIGSSYDINVSQGDYSGIALNDWVQVNSTGSVNYIKFGGKDLDISAGNLIGGTNVVIGDTQSQTDLVIKNNRLFFGDASGSDLIYFQDPNYVFYTNGLSSASLILTGKVYLNAGSDTKQLAFGVTDSDCVNYNDTTNTFEFFADASIANSSLEAGHFTAHNNTSFYLGAANTGGKINYFQFVTSFGSKFGNAAGFSAVSTFAATVAGTTVFKSGVFGADGAADPTAASDYNRGIDLIIPVNGGGTDPSWKFNQVNNFFFGGQTVGGGQAYVTGLMGNPLIARNTSGVIHAVNFGTESARLDLDEGITLGEFPKRLRFRSATGSYSGSAIEAGKILIGGGIGIKPAPNDAPQTQRRYQKLSRPIPLFWKETLTNDNYTFSTPGQGQEILFGVSHHVWMCPEVNRGTFVEFTFEVQRITVNLPFTWQIQDEAGDELATGGTGTPTATSAWTTYTARCTVDQPLQNHPKGIFLAVQMTDAIGQRVRIRNVRCHVSHDWLEYVAGVDTVTP